MNLVKRMVNEVGHHFAQGIVPMVCAEAVGTGQSLRIEHKNDLVDAVVRAQVAFRRRADS